MATETVARSPYLQVAVDIGERLAVQQLEADAGVTWMGDEIEGTTLENAVIVRREIQADLYGGLSGIACFLAHLARVSGSPETARLAERCARTALARAHDLVDQDSLSLFSGATGIALAVSDVALALPRPELLLDARDLTRKIVARLEAGRGVGDTDLLSGLAGVIIGLLHLHDRTGEESCRRLVQRLGHELVARACDDPSGTCWRDPSVDAAQPALCGLAHGASGPAWALLEVWSRTQEQAFLDAVHAACRYERSWFSAERCAWADLRDARDGGECAHAYPSYMTAWCHGGIGIGAVRLRIYELTRDLTALADASAAIESARALVMSAGQARGGAGAPPDVTLCHGLAGAAELFLLAYEVLREPSHLRAARRVGDLMLQFASPDRSVWPWGARGAEFVPGLFLGLAGIGTTFLRLADPAGCGSPALAGRRAPESAPAHSVMLQPSHSA